MLSLDQGNTLLKLARDAIAEHLGYTPIERLQADWLHQPGATFVTLTKNKELRGCIGSLEARLPLIEDVQNNAVAAAFHDPRFDPLTESEYAEISIEVSLLGTPEPLNFTYEDEALSQLVPDRDGVILEMGHHRATFLPQVWSQLPIPSEFLAHLKNKAGLPPDYWSDELHLSRYTVQKWTEGEQHG